MVTEPALVSAQDLIVATDYGQLYIYSAVDEPDVCLAALDDARNSGRHVGVLPGFIDLLTPGLYNFETPLRLEVWSADPPDDRDQWDHEVDADLDIPAGQIFFEASGGGPSSSASVPAGAYRVRISSRGLSEVGTAGAEGTDTYRLRLRLWPRGRQTDPVLRKCWPEWDSPPAADPGALPANQWVQTDERRQYWMTDYVWMRDWGDNPDWIKAPRPEDDLVNLVMEGRTAAIFTAGPREVDVLVEFLTAPPARDPERFDDIAEVTMPLHIQLIAIAYPDDLTGPDLGPYMPQEYPQEYDDLRDYRVRFSAKRTYREQAEYHLIQIWPADASA